MKRKTHKRRNPVAQALRTPRYRSQAVRSGKWYVRKLKHPNRGEE